MKSKSSRPDQPIKDVLNYDSTVFFEGQAIAVGEDTTTSMKLNLDVSDKKILSIAKGVSEGVAISRSDTGNGAYADVYGQFFSSEADIVIQRTDTTRNSWTNESGDWSATVSTTSYLAIDLYWIDIPQTRIQISSDLPFESGTSGSVFSGNTAFGQAALTVDGDRSMTNFFLDVFTLEDSLSSTTLMGYASVVI